MPPYGIDLEDVERAPAEPFRSATSGVPPVVAARGADPVEPPRCPNCGAAAGDSYCPRCGQEQHDSHRSIRSILGDALDAFAGWDAKIPSTLALLLVRPGRLTQQYLSGRRVRYLRPLRLYLMLSVVCFVALRYEANKSDMQIAKVVNDAPRATAPSSPAAGPRAPADGLATAGDATERLRERRADGIDSAEFGEFLAHRPGEGQGGAWVRFKSRFKDRFRTLSRLPKEDGQRMIREAFFAKVGTMMFCLLPVYALLLRLLYRRARLFYAEHFVFALHTHAFAFGILTLMALLTEAGRAAKGIPVGWLAASLSGTAQAVSVVLAVWMPVYAFVALRRVYGGSRRRTLVKYLLLGGLYSVVALTALGITALAAVIVG